MLQSTAMKLLCDWNKILYEIPFFLLFYHVFQNPWRSAFCSSFSHICLWTKLFYCAWKWNWRIKWQKRSQIILDYFSNTKSLLRKTNPIFLIWYILLFFIWWQKLSHDKSIEEAKWVGMVFLRSASVGTSAWKYKFKTVDWNIFFCCKNNNSNVIPGGNQNKCATRQF